jgi:hypothetical protein
MRRLSPKERRLLRRTIMAMKQEQILEVEDAWASLLAEVEHLKASGYFRNPAAVDRILYGNPRRNRAAGAPASGDEGIPQSR